MADSLLPFYKGWDHHQGLLIQAIRPLSADDLTLRAAPMLRPVWFLAAHIISARVYWFNRYLGVNDAVLVPLQAWDDDGMPVRTVAELVDGLEATWRLIETGLRQWTPAMLDDSFTTPGRPTRTRQWVIWHVIEHDLSHGGELFLTLGAHGLPTPDL